MNTRLLLLTIGAFAIGTDSYIVAGILLDIANDMSISISSAGQLVTVFALTIAITAPVLTTLTAKMSPTKILFWTMLLFSIGNIISFLSSTFAMLIISRIIAAMGAALYFPIATLIAAKLAAPGKQGKSISAVSSGLTIAITLGVPIGTWLGNIFNWRIAFLIIAIVGFFVCLLTTIMIPKLEQTNDNASTKDQLPPLKKATVFFLMTAILFITTGSFAVYTFIDPILQAIGDFNLIGLSSMLALFGASSIIGVWLGGYLNDRIGSLPTIYLTIAIKILSLFAFSFIMLYDFSSNVILAGLATISWGITAWMLNAPLLNYLITISPKSPSLLLALNATFSYLGTSAGSALGGFVIDNDAIEMLGLICGLCQLIALLIILVTAKVQKRQALAQQLEV
ncbi:MFS transporter [Paenibacillus agilis]|uniref:MFS transporter n=1 Tax=Paenibacillus agilis TaxID=3020863 RepID=UPI001649D3BC|nr:MFS transporter [Paenibacillus agilis]